MNTLTETNLKLELILELEPIEPIGLTAYCEYNQRCARPPIYPVVEQPLDIWALNFYK